MLSFEQSKKILNKGSVKYTDEQVQLIRKILNDLANLEIAIKQEIRKNKNSTNIHQGEHNRPN